MFKKITTKDVVFLAIFSGVLLLVSGLVMPIVMFTKIFALRQLAAALLFSLFCTIALIKVPKLGAMTIIGLITGLVLSFMSVIMLINNLLGAVLVDIIILIFFKGEITPKRAVIAVGLYIPFTIPLTLVSGAIMNGTPIMEQLGNVWLSIALIGGTFVLSYIGSLLGYKVAKELRKAGKLQ